jgi:hypothetical protein
MKYYSRKNISILTLKMSDRKFMIYDETSISSLRSDTIR